MSEQPAVILEDKWNEGLRTFDGREQLLKWAFEYLQVQTHRSEIPQLNQNRIRELVDLVKDLLSHAPSIQRVLGELLRIASPANSQGSMNFEQWWQSSGSRAVGAVVPGFNLQAFSRMIAQAAYEAAQAHSGNYTTDDAVEPYAVRFSNGRTVTVNDSGFLTIGWDK